ncbi:MAG TPA: FecR domain-containing protein [Bacteroidales bacterium]|nr:FecR domain-containing protein [Bacteroidales bacterium]
MMEKTHPDENLTGNHNNQLSSDEEQIAALFQSAHMAQGLDTDKARESVRRLIRHRLINRRLIHTLSYAALALLLVGLWWWTRHQETYPSQEPQLVQTAVPERTDKALLVLSDGSLVSLDTLSSFQLSEAGLATISSNRGSMLAYKAGDESASEISKTNKIIVPAGGRFQLVLSDGTSVWLNAGTSLEYPVVFGRGERYVSLSGEAFFEVATDPQRPFIIQTGSGKLQVLGTSFNVSAYQEDEFMETTLVSGALQVTTSNGMISRLLPGQQHKLNQMTFEQTVSQVDTKFYTSWRDGVIYFNRVSLKELAVKLERWYDVQITFQNESSGKLIFSGAVENSRRLDFLLALIAEASGLEYKINGKQVLIK